MLRTLAWVCFATALLAAVVDMLEGGFFAGIWPLNTATWIAAFQARTASDA
jgi:hypothetical protein